MLHGWLAAIHVQRCHLEGAPLALWQVQRQVHVWVKLDAHIAAVRALQRRLVHALHMRCVWDPAIVGECIGGVPHPRKDTLVCNNCHLLSEINAGLRGIAKQSQ